MLNGPFQNGFQNGPFLQGFAKRKGVSDLGKKKAQKSSQEIFEAILLSNAYSGIFPTMSGLSEGLQRWGGSLCDYCLIVTIA